MTEAAAEWQESAALREALQAKDVSCTRSSVSCTSFACSASPVGVVCAKARD